MVMLLQCLREDFYDIVRYATGRGLNVVVGSNGTTIDVDAARRMKEAGVKCV